MKNLLFDLGGVIIDIKRQNCIDAFVKLGMTNIADFLGDYAQSGIFMAVEDGSLSADDFRKQLHTMLPPDVTDGQIDEAFQAFIVGIPEHRLQALRNLRAKGYKLYLLSNTNPIMWNGIIDREFRKEGLTREDYFDGMTTSFEAKCAKPDPAIFDYACRTMGIRPEDTVFYDDSSVNTAAAEKLGFKTVHVLPGTEFTDYPIPQ